jgi:polyhydroxybutyrate depolymerase
MAGWFVPENALRVMLLPLVLLLGAAPVERDPLVTARPYELVVPGKQEGALPLVVLLHGYGSSARGQDAYFKYSALARERGFLLALPDGTLNKRGQRFWNATDACCGFESNVDDVAYLTAVVKDVQAHHAVDPKRVFFIGHSNGGFMSHRMACERSELVAAFVSLAGSSWLDRSRCTPSQKVNVLQVHGLADVVVKPEGGALRRAPYASLAQTIGSWGELNGCKEAARAGDDVDLVVDLPGAETQREALQACASGGAVELWKIKGGPHSPFFRPSWAGFTFDWLMAHPKP